jgi:hypothetical protein
MAPHCGKASRFAIAQEKVVALEFSEKPSSAHICHQCVKSGAELTNGNVMMMCLRCKVPRYCSRECQVAAWKKHKPNGIPPAARHAASK